MAGILTQDDLRPWERLKTMARHIRVWAGGGFSWRDNCASSVLAYAEEVTGLAYHAAPVVATRRHAAAFLRRERGLIRVAARAASRLGLVPVDQPTAGDVGIVRDPRGRALAAIWTGRHWAARSRKGVLLQEAVVIKAWGFDA